MAIKGYELYQVTSEYVTADLIVWRRYKKYAPGIVEAMLDANPQLAVAHQSGPFIPVGTFVRVPIDHTLIRGAIVSSTAELWTDKRGYSL